jgi:hypothetical protein
MLPFFMLVEQRAGPGKSKGSVIIRRLMRPVQTESSLPAIKNVEKCLSN